VTWERTTARLGVKCLCLTQLQSAPDGVSQSRMRAFTAARTLQTVFLRTTLLCERYTCLSDAEQSVHRHVSYSLNHSHDDPQCGLIWATKHSPLVLIRPIEYCACRQSWV